MIRPATLSLALLLSGATSALAQSDFSGTWEVAVREFGQKNFYLPMVDGRLTVIQQGCRCGARAASCRCLARGGGSVR